MRKKNVREHNDFFFIIIIILPYILGMKRFGIPFTFFQAKYFELWVKKYFPEKKGQE